MVRAYKPHRELFEKALEISGCSADEVMHIGDSYISDVPGAREAGITPVLIQRDVTSTCPDDCIVIHSLEEVYQYIECYDK
jgi:putative hydrolase of the HAD superfamily